MSKTDYNKVPKDIEGQIALLKERNLIIPDESKAAKVLANISYNRLSNYWYPLLADPKDDEIFKDGANFDNVFHIYQFDCEIRILVFYAIEQIEIAFRTQLIYHLSVKHNSGFWYNQSTLFRRASIFDTVCYHIGKSLRKTNKVFIKKYQRKYNQAFPPAWKSFEIITFTNLFLIYDNLKSSRDKKPISKHFGLHSTVFSTWIETLIEIRNICAHHSRLWNIIPIKTPKFPRSTNDSWVSKWGNTEVTNEPIKMYAICCILGYLLDHVNPYHSFKPKLKELLTRFESDIDIAHMGFPNDWKNEPLWKTEE